MFIGGNVIPATAYQESPVWTPSPGGGGFDPTIYGTVTEYLNADDISGSDGDPITTWVAQIGANVVAPSGKEPILRTGANGISGKNALEFGAMSGPYMQAASAINIRTLFIVSLGGTTSLQSPSAYGQSGAGGNAGFRLGLLIDSTHWYSGDSGDIIVISMVNGVTTFSHSSASREVVSGQSGSTYTPSAPFNLIAIGGATNAGWNWVGNIAMWLAYSDAPDMATVQSAILAQYP